MKITISKIRDLNTVLLFLAITLSVFALIVGFLISVIPRNINEGIKIVNENKKNEHIQTTVYADKLNDYIVFFLKSKALSLHDNSDKVLEFSKEYSSRNSSKIVNIIFISLDTKEETKLLENDSLIVSHWFSNEKEQNRCKLSKNIYAIVSQDTNKDKTLSIEDSVDLYVSDYNGDKLKKIGSNIYSYNLIDNDMLLFKENKAEQNIYKIYSVSNDTVGTIKTVVEPAGEKNF